MVRADGQHGILLGPSRHFDAIDNLSTCLLRRWAQGFHPQLFELAPRMDRVHFGMSRTRDES
jgi:hypothetical protein